MSIAFVLLGCMLLLTTPSAAVLSVCTGVLSCGCPISISRFPAGIASLELIYRAPSLAPAADGITALTICGMFLEIIFTKCKKSLQLYIIAKQPVFADLNVYHSPKHNFMPRPEGGRTRPLLSTIFGLFESLHIHLIY